jgi:hypothetical protein
MSAQACGPNTSEQIEGNEAWNKAAVCGVGISASPNNM